MKTRIVKIGNSKGIRIPKILLDQTELKDEVEISVDEDRLIIHRVQKPREGWNESFAIMAQDHDDGLMDSMDQMDHSFDDEEWEWI